MQKEELYSIKRLFLDYCRMDIKMPVMCLIGAFLKAMAPYITIVLIGRLIDAATLGVDVKTLISWALVAIVLSRLLTIISIKIKELASAKEEYMVEITNRVFAEKSLTEDYEHLEDLKWNNIRQQFEAMNKSGSGIFGKMFELLDKISEGFFSLLFSLIVMIPLIMNKEIDSMTPFSGNISTVIMIVLIMILLVFKLKRGSVIMKEGLDTETVLSAPYTKKTGWYKDTLSVIENGKDIRIFNQLDGVKNDYDDAEDHILLIMKKALMAYFREEALTEIVMGICTIIIYTFAVYRAYIGLLSIGEVITIVSAVTETLKSNTLIVEFMEGLPALAERSIFYCQYMDMGARNHKGTIATESIENNFSFEFENVSFKYPGTDNYVIKNLTLTLDSGSKFAVVGPNGSGKTTFIKLLTRLYDVTEGTIKLNGINIKDYDYDEYMRLFGVVFQDFSILSFKIGENVASDDVMDDSKGTEAVAKAGLANLMGKMPDWPEKYVGKDFSENGINLSGGEKQKLAIARAIYKDAPFAIMDEPTAALDPVSECEVFAGFDKMVGKKTALYISHRLASCKFCEKILVFEDGNVVQQGSHDELIMNEGLYKRLWNAQAQYYA